MLPSGRRPTPRSGSRSTAAGLRAATYEEVEADATATPQAVLVVVLAALAGGVSAIRATGVVQPGAPVVVIGGWPFGSGQVANFVHVLVV